MRVFIAIDITQNIKNEIGNFIRACKKIPDAPVKYVGIENLHITLKFLGDLENDSLQSLIEEFSKISPSISELAVHSAGAFPSLDFTKIAWVGIRENPDLKQAFMDIEKICQNNGFMPEERDFHPHITIARIKGRVTNDWINVIRKYSAFEFGHFIPEGFCIYRSDLNKSGPLYTKLSFFPFKEVHGGK